MTLYSAAEATPTLPILLIAQETHEAQVLSLAVARSQAQQGAALCFALELCCQT